MLYYPQLSTGAVSQFPVARNVDMRSVANQLLSGSTIRMADLGWQRIQWRLRYAALTNSERTSIETLFEAAEGQLTTFTFVDPTGNLLQWSEDWTQTVWTADPLLQVVAGIEDPFGGSDAVQLTNAAETTQEIVQNTAAPSSLLYCYSVYVRSSVPITVQLVVRATGQSALMAVEAVSAWMRVSPVAGGCGDRRLWGSGGSATGSRTVQEDYRPGRSLSEYQVLFRPTRFFGGRGQSELLSS
jgi:hypothetical protein